MANIEITNNTCRSVRIWDPIYLYVAVVFAAAATYLKGTILAFKAVADAVVADGTGNTGDGTVTLATVAAGVIIPAVGAYNFECTAAVTHGGVFKLEDPSGNLVVTGITLTAGAGVATVVTAGGLTFTVTDSTNDFIVGDKFSLTVAESNTVVPFEKDGAGGAQLPRYILQSALTATGAGSVPQKVIISGRVRKSDLVINSDGDASNVDAVVVEQLRNYTIIADDTTLISELDNQ